ncbi:DNA helicase [Asticcacaulis endophyticus]|uniref:DNA helicase n=2 Tax=Asticcacaulis endophyticus TaxID=1395890 RepID=A0A918Q6T6_9CAUL|nr:DNA helicase [Asticcacaulis endophyticus]
MACAGSGKTKTAVHRLIEMRRLLDDAHGMVALLSFSNVAVETFKKDYYALMQGSGAGRRSFGIEIDTVDGFITTNVLRPHGHRTMGCNRAPYLVEGREPFLKSFTVYDGERNNPTTDIRITVDAGVFNFQVGSRSLKTVVPSEARRALQKLGSHGAYTHGSARYWVLRILKEQPFVLRALVRRYPHILVDEAQDIGAEHQAILELMIAAGTKLSLIGDSHQGIYEFAHANGAFLAEYGTRPGVTSQQLNINYRSVPAILKVANILSGRNDGAHRQDKGTLSGAFYVPFQKTEKEKTLAVFRSLLNVAKIDEKHGVVLCRSADWALDWSGAGDGQGQGIVRSFAEATICRDKLHNMADAFAHASAGVVGLLADKHGDLISRLAKSRMEPQDVKIKRAIWTFVKDPATGLPSGTLLADKEWHPSLSTRAKAFVQKLAADHGLTVADNLGQRLAKKALENRPLLKLPDLAGAQPVKFRISTVHKAKGESLEAVMYVASKEHLRQLLDGTATEVGRIGYVAVTRAKDLFVLAVPKSCLAEFEPELIAKGFQKPGIADY